MEKVMMRFPDESYPIEVEIDWKDFQQTNEFSDEVFGWYRGGLVAINKNSIQNDANQISV